MTHYQLEPRRPMRLMTAAVLLLLISASQSGCLFRRKKAAPPAAPPPPQRLVLLPLHMPQDIADRQWMAMAAPVEAARAAMASKDLELVPLWESMPVTIESAGANRSITTEVAAYVASRMGARWAVLSELTSANGSPSLLIDFIPARATLVPYRYEKESAQEDLAARYYEATQQFLRYLAVRPPAKLEGQGDAASLKTLAEALDQEYGWTVEAQPGKAERFVAGLASSDPRLARLLFNPTLYPVVGGAPQEPPKAPTVAPPPPPAPQRLSQAPVESAPAAPAARAPEAAPPPPEAQYLDIEIPPPKTFTQSIRLGKASARSLPKSATESPPPARPRPVPAPRPSRRFQIQVFSSPNRVEAEKLAERLRAEGYDPSLEATELPDKGTWYRLRLQGYASRKEAERAGKELVGRNLIREYWLVP